MGKELWRWRNDAPQLHKTKVTFSRKDIAVAVPTAGGGRISCGMSTKRIEMGRGHAPLTTIKKIPVALWLSHCLKHWYGIGSLRHQDFHGSPDSAIMPLRNNVGINPPWVSWLRTFVSLLFSSEEKTSGINSSEYNFECAG